MNDVTKNSSHIDDATLWQWQSHELDQSASAGIDDHLQHCAACQQRARARALLVHTMQNSYRAVQPTLSEQMQLQRALQNQFMPAGVEQILITSSRKLVRWLAPAVAILATMFLLWRDDNVTASTTVFFDSPESSLALATSDEQWQQAMVDLALSEDEVEK